MEDEEIGFSDVYEYLALKRQRENHLLNLQEQILSKGFIEVTFELEQFLAFDTRLVVHFKNEEDYLLAKIIGLPHEDIELVYPSEQYLYAR